MQSSNDSLSVLAPPVSGSPAVLLTPGRTRNIAQDMEALRLSRQDNPYLQQVMASRESLIESHSQDCESDDTILMSQEFGSAALDFAEDDPLTLKEVHEHMIRSPPPTSSWPHEMPYRAASAFDFSADSPISYSAYSVNSQDKEYLGGKSPRRKAEESRNTPSRPRSSRSVSPRSHDLTLCGRPLSLPDHIVQLHRSLGFGRQMKHKYAMELAHVLRLVALEEVRPKPTLTATTTTDPHHRTRKSPSYGAQ